MYSWDNRYVKEYFYLTNTNSCFITKSGFDTMKYLHSRIEVYETLIDPGTRIANYTVPLLNNWNLKSIRKTFINEDLT